MKSCQRKTRNSSAKYIAYRCRFWNSRSFRSPLYFPGRDAPTAHAGHDRPWYIGLLLGASGWLAGLFLLGFVALLFSPDKPPEAALAGAVLLAPLARHADPRRELIAALYSKGRLRLDYDASSTRSASQAFASRAGNCLSLVIMTASFARQLGLPVSFQAVQTDDIYSRSGGLYMASGHVNLVLGPPAARSGYSQVSRESLTIDFIPQDELRGQRTRTNARTRKGPRKAIKK